MLGRANPMKQAGSQITNWSRITCRYQRFQRASDSAVMAARFSGLRDADGFQKAFSFFHSSGCLSA